MNDSRTDNAILGSFFLPIYDKSKIMIAGKVYVLYLGSGHSTLVKAFFVRQVNRVQDPADKDRENNNNRDSSNNNPGEKRNCDCCISF